MSKIEFFDALGKKVYEVDRRTYARISQQAASDHRQMDKAKEVHPEIEKAVIADLWWPFVYRNGKSQSTFNGTD